MPIPGYTGDDMEQTQHETITTTRPGSRRAARRSRTQQLITADESSLIELDVLLATLPLCSTGRVFVEVPDASHIVDLAVPSRMVLTWLDRSRRSGAPGTGRSCAPGAALTRAVTAWADEMLCDEASAPEAERTRVHLLGGFLGTADIVDHLSDRLEVPSTSIHTPERFGTLIER